MSPACEGRQAHRGDDAGRPPCPLRHQHIRFQIRCKRPMRRGDDGMDIDEATADRRSGPPVTRPGKIIAVHLRYASRAEQRGRRPAHPSYFFKPASSLASSGGTIERPAGTELLAFEGEIALVIGTAAR